MVCFSIRKPRSGFTLLPSVQQPALLLGILGSSVGVRNDPVRTCTLQGPAEHVESRMDAIKRDAIVGDFDSGFGPVFPRVLPFFNFKAAPIPDRQEGTNFAPKTELKAQHSMLRWQQLSRTASECSFFMLYETTLKSPNSS